MGNWHCVPSSCATVNYREYVGGKVRWRYGTDPWQEIIGADNYSVNNIASPFTGGQCPTRYDVRVYYDVFSNNRLIQANASTAVTLYGPISNVYFIQGNLLVINCRNANGTPYVYQNNVFSYLPFCFCQLKDVVLRPFSGSDNCGNRPNQYEFKIFKQGVEVHFETRTTPPQVEVIPCSLSAVSKAIKIKKYPYLDRVEVVPYFYDVRWGLLTDSSNYGFLLVKGQIPSECLNIYNNDVTSTIPATFGNAANTPEKLYRLIGQICSAPGCPPPVYNVACDDCCQSCPDGTCPIDCDGQICCYNYHGLSIQTISKVNYCGGAIL